MWGAALIAKFVGFKKLLSGDAAKALSFAFIAGVVLLGLILAVKGVEAGAGAKRDASWLRSINTAVVAAFKARVRRAEREALVADEARLEADKQRDEAVAKIVELERQMADMKGKKDVIFSREERRALFKR